MLKKKSRSIRNKQIFLPTIKEMIQILFLVL